MADELPSVALKSRGQQLSFYRHVFRQAVQNEVEVNLTRDRHIEAGVDLTPFRAVAI